MIIRFSVAEYFSPSVSDSGNLAIGWALLPIPGLLREDHSSLFHDISPLRQENGEVKRREGFMNKYLMDLYKLSRYDFVQLGKYGVPVVSLMSRSASTEFVSHS